MAVSEYELAAILDHCRALIDAADQFEDYASARADNARRAKVQWEGPYRDEFGSRFEEEADDLGRRVRGLRSEADDWAIVWAETVNTLNQERHQQAVDEISSNRGLGESFVDVFVGDDSSEQVRPYQPVSVPTRSSRYAATGGLETF